MSRFSKSSRIRAKGRAVQHEFLLMEPRAPAGISTEEERHFQQVDRGSCNQSKMGPKELMGKNQGHFHCWVKVVYFGQKPTRNPRSNLKNPLRLFAMTVTLFSK